MATSMSCPSADWILPWSSQVDGPPSGCGTIGHLVVLQIDLSAQSRKFSTWWQGRPSTFSRGCPDILSIAALKLGAKTVLGVDIDIESVKNSRENADTNGVGEELLLGQGSVTEILAGNFQLKSAPFVVANILGPILIRLFDAGLADLVEPNGEIILSGILAHQAENVIEAAQAKGLKRSDQRQIADWVAISLKR